MNLPPIGETKAQIEFKPLASSYPWLCVFSSLISWAVLLVVLLVSEYWIDNLELPNILWLWLGLLVLLSLVFTFYAAKACAYQQGSFELMFKSGLWWKKKTAVSFSRIQHIDLSHGPLERKLGLASLKFFTAGGAMSDLKIPGLPKATAESIREGILKYAEAEYQSSDEQ